MKKIFTLISFVTFYTSIFAQTFTLASKDLGGQFTNEFVAGNFGCNGKNLSPELHWSNPPAGTKGFAVTMYDPDAPTGSGFWHWVVINLPASTSQLSQGAGNADLKLLPAGSLQGQNDTGSQGYQGPCPDDDTPHRYLITVYALNTDKLSAPPNATAALTGFLLNKASIAKASLIVYCKK
ncbi:YbhB/YbcL family Raf kinase inhibitor-like protein [Mucilaginibacter limnophilus]|uniref:YbhB/YbcL family Raf kinase inhibitor-like protein n=1 Tax=Mucilaginibacter limnophilus TaxID=1932778 RepID=A0A3S2Y3D2_9SPHI|nr:YbhB/YbcL family Raf kinase inhibitor-like protein [Mucilaginibacter limnophilus]RVU01008.1 YbhB/YbcL family Raf kinase inhibitor-like protein [Mucilaginibacter limnophilus]